MIVIFHQVWYREHDFFMIFPWFHRVFSVIFPWFMKWKLIVMWFSTKFLHITVILSLSLHYVRENPVWDHTGLYRTLQSLTGTNKYKRDHKDPNGTLTKQTWSTGLFEDIQGNKWPYKSIQDQTGLYEIIQDPMGLWDPTGSKRTVLNHTGSSRTIQDSTGPYGNIRR